MTAGQPPGSPRGGTAPGGSVPHGGTEPAVPVIPLPSMLLQGGTEPAASAVPSIPLPSVVKTDPVAPVVPAAPAAPVAPVASSAPPTAGRSVEARPEHAESVQGNTQRGTDGSLVAPQYTPTDVGDIMPPRRVSGPLLGLGVAVAMAAGVGVMAMVMMPAPTPDAAPEPVPEAVATAEPAPALSKPLQALAQVNVLDPAKAQPFERRHALLEQLRGGPDAARIDTRLNLALDLQQAGDSPTPCETYSNALAEVQAEPHPYYGDVLDRVRAPDPSCAALDDQRQALLAQVRPPAEPEPEPEPEPKRRGSGKRVRRPAKPQSKPKSDSESSAVGGKLSDGLKAFGK